MDEHNSVLPADPATRATFAIARIRARSRDERRKRCARRNPFRAIAVQTQKVGTNNTKQARAFRSGAEGTERVTLVTPSA